MLPILLATTHKPQTCHKPNAETKPMPLQPINYARESPCTMGPPFVMTAVAKGHVPDLASTVPVADC